MTKRKPMRMLIAVGIAITMLFTIVALSACNTDLITLTQRADSLGQQVYAAQNGGNPTVAEIDALLAELEALRADVIRLEGENSELLARIDEYRVQLEALNAGITVELEARIKQTVYEYLRRNGFNQHVAIVDIRIATYGYYNGAIALSFWHVADGDPPLGDKPWYENVGGVEFNRHSYAPIVIWHNDRLLSITEAFYNYEILTIEDLKTIKALGNWN